MNDLALQSNNLPTQFNPSKSGDMIAQVDSVIAYAKRVKDWDLLEQAANKKIEEIKEFVQWWQDNVSAGHGGDRSKITRTVILLSVEKAEEHTGFSVMQVSRLRTNLKNEDKYRDKIYGAAYAKAFPGAPHGTENSGDPEWYTPVKYIEATRELLGDIDLDPASNSYANNTVHATKYYSKSDDGLSHAWNGTVWLNPPYSHPELSHFVHKLGREYSEGGVTAAILLTNNSTDTSWFHEALADCSAVCFTRGRIKFEKVDGEFSAPTFGQSFFYYGKDVSKFKRIFCEFGFIVETNE